MKCASCGAEISYVGIVSLKHDGKDLYCNHLYFHELPEYDCVSITYVNPERYVGYKNNNMEELRKTIRCPICGQYPFYGTEIKVYDAIEVVCCGIKEREIEEE